MSAVPSEQCGVHWGSEYDEMRMITTSFARVLELTFRIPETANQAHFF